MILFVEGFLVSLLWPGLPLAITITLARVLNLEARVASFKMNKLRFNFFGAECFELWKKSLDRLKRPYERECCIPYHLRLHIVLTRGIPAAFHEGVHIYTANRYWVSPKFIGSLPRVRWHIISKRVFS